MALLIAENPPPSDFRRRMAAICSTVTLSRRETASSGKIDPRLPKRANQGVILMVPALALLADSRYLGGWKGH